MQFPTTHWSLLAKATLSGQTEARAALEQLCERYWRPVNQFVVMRGYSQAEADDLTQNFLLHLMEHSTFRRADQMRGRFRSFLLGALVRFLADERERRNAQKRGGTIPHASLDDPDRDEAVVAVSAEDTLRFDRDWAVNVLRAALDQVKAEYTAAGREPAFAVFRSYLPGAGEPAPYDAAAAKLGVSVAAFTTELHRLRQRIRDLARSDVMQTVSAPHELEDELAHLRRVLMDRGTDFLDSAES